MTAPPIFPLETALGAIPYPPPLGSTFPVKRQRRFSTGRFESVSGRRIRVIRRVAVLTDFTIDFDALNASPSVNQGMAAASLQTVRGFVDDTVGGYGAFIFLDPSDCTLTSALIGVGDGTTTSFVVTRRIGLTYAEPVGWVFLGDITSVTVAGSPVMGFSVTDPNTLVLASAPTTGQQVRITVSKFYYQCTAPDDAEFEELMATLWQAPEIKFSSLVSNYPTLNIVA